VGPVSFPCPVFTPQTPRVHKYPAFCAAHTPREVGENHASAAAIVAGQDRASGQLSGVGEAWQPSKIFYSLPLPERIPNLVVAV